MTQPKPLVIECPKSKTLCVYSLREIDPELCSWCGQLLEIRRETRKASRAARREPPRQEADQEH